MSDPNTEHVISMLRACVLSTKNEISLKMLRLDYSRLVGSEIPYRELGYKTLEGFLESIPDLKITRGPEGYVTISAAPTERSQHIADLVSRQKSPVKKISPKYIPPDRRSASSWTSPYKSSIYKLREENYSGKTYGEFGYKGRDSFRGRGSNKSSSSSDRYHPIGRGYLKDLKQSDQPYKAPALRSPDRYNARDYYKVKVASAPDDVSIEEDWDEPEENTNAVSPKSQEAVWPRRSSSPPNDDVPLSFDESESISPITAPVSVSSEVDTGAKPVVEEDRKVFDQSTIPLHSRLTGPTPAQLRLNAQRKAALKKSEEEAAAKNADDIDNLMETLDYLTVKSSQLIEMEESMPLNVTYYSLLMTEYIVQKGLPKAEVVVKSRWVHNVKLHSCELKLGVLEVTSFPYENMDPNVVVEFACREVLRAINQLRLPIEVHSTHPKNVLHRILRMIFLHPRGIWNTSLPRLYSVAFKEHIPSKWMDLVQMIDKHQVLIVQSQNAGVFILKPNLVGLNILFNEPSVSPTQNQDTLVVQQNQAMSILMQDLSQTPPAYSHGMGLPIQAGQMFMPICSSMRSNPLIRTPMFLGNPLAPNTFVPMGASSVQPRICRGRGSRNIESADQILNAAMFTQQFLLPTSQETNSVPSLPPSQDTQQFLNNTLPLSESSHSSQQVTIAPATTSYSGSETASSTTMSLPALSPEAKSPVFVSELVIENISRHAANGINEKLSLPTDDAWDVQVTAANSIQDVWVRLIGDFHSVAYNNMAADMEIHYMNLNDDPVVPVEPALGSYYAIQLESCWHRVKLVELPEANDQPVTLFFIDQGDEEKYPFSMCHYLDPMFKTLPGQAVQCHLAFMEMFRKDTLITEHLINMLVGNCFVANILSLENSKAYIVLYNTENNTDVNVNNLIVEQLADSLNPANLNEVGSVIEVLLSHISSDGSVYMQMLDTAYYCIQYMTYQLTNYPMKKGTKSPNPFRSEEVYLARYNLEEDLLRVIIKSKPDDQQQVLVHYIDYGFQGSIPIKLLIRATDFSKAIQEIPPLAKNVKLSNLPPSRMSVRMAARLRDLVPNSVSVLAKILKRPDGDLAEIELFKRIQPDNLLVSVNNTLLLDPQLASSEAEEPVKAESSTQVSETKGQQQTSVASPVVETPCVDEAIPTERLESVKQSIKLLVIPNIGEEFDVHVAMASNPSNFTVQPWGQNQQLHQMMQEMQKVYAEQDHAELTLDDIIPGGLYAALNSTDNHWYRATVSRKMGSLDKAAIFVCFTDFGDFNIVPIDKIKLLDARFRELPVQAIKAKLSDVGPVHADWSVEACLFFQNLVNQREFVSIVMENGPDLLNTSDTVVGLRLIDTSSDKDVYINKLLIEKGHAVYHNTADLIWLEL